MTTSQFRALLAMVRMHWYAVAMCVLVGGLAGAAVSTAIQPTYEATATIFVAAPNWNDNTASWQPDNAGHVPTYAFGDEFTQNRVVSYRQLATSDRVASAVIDQLALTSTPSELSAKITARVIPDTVMMEIRASDGSPSQAARIADAAANALCKLIQGLETPFSQTVSPVQPIVIAPAKVPAAPLFPKLVPNVIAGIVLGLLVGLTYSAARERYLASEFAIGERSLGVLAVPSLSAFVTLDDVDGELAESARYVRRRLSDELDRAMGSVGGRSILFTSPRSGDAVGSAAALLAAAISEHGDRAVIVMTNFGSSPATGPGLGEVLDGKTALDEAMGMGGGVGVRVLVAGSIESPPAASLGSEDMSAVLAQLKTDFDYVVVLGAPVLESVESLEIAAVVDAAVLVCDVPPTTAAESEEAERLLGPSGAKTLGRLTVLASGPGGRRSARHRVAVATRTQNG